MKRIFKNKDKVNEFIGTQPEHIKAPLAKIAANIDEYKEGVWTVHIEDAVPVKRDQPPHQTTGWLSVTVEFEPFELG